MVAPVLNSLRRIGREIVLFWALSSIATLLLIGFRKGTLVSILSALTVGIIVGPCCWLAYRVFRFLFFPQRQRISP
jgi:hypothetical protein